MAVATVAAGQVLNRAGAPVGEAGAPFFVQLTPDFDWLALVAGALFAAAIWAAGRLAAPRVGAAGFAAGAFVLTLVLRLALNAVRDGPAAWSTVFGSGYEARNEYLPALGALRAGAGPFLDRFVQLAPTLPIHPSVHPPGLLLALDLLGIRSADAMAALTIGVGALCTPLVYALGRVLLDDARGRTAALLFAFAPASLIFGATSADALFATLSTAAAAALVARGWRLRALGAGLLAVASFFSYALTAIGAWAVLVVARSRGWRAGAALAGACVLALAGGYALLHALTGFDVLGALETANRLFRRDVAGQRPYLYWLVGSPVAFLLALGLPLAWHLLRGVARREPSAVALAAVVVAAALLGFTKGETERLWLFLVAPACVAVAAAQRRAAPWLLVALSLQAFAVELVLDTRW